MGGVARVGRASGVAGPCRASAQHIVSMTAHTVIGTHFAQARSRRLPALGTPRRVATSGGMRTAHVDGGRLPPGRSATLSPAKQRAREQAALGPCRSEASPALGVHPASPGSADIAISCASRHSLTTTSAIVAWGGGASSATSGCRHLDRMSCAWRSGDGVMLCWGVALRAHSSSHFVVDPAAWLHLRNKGLRPLGSHKSDPNGAKRCPTVVGGFKIEMVRDRGLCATGHGKACPWRVSQRREPSPRRFWASGCVLVGIVRPLSTACPVG